MKQLGVGFMCVAVILILVAGASAQYDTTEVYQIQQGAYTVGDSVFVDSVIVTAIDLKPTTYGFHVQEPEGGAYSGILIYMNGERPDTIGGIGVELGDLVKVSGQYDEYYMHSEIQTDEGRGVIRIIQEDYGEPACTTLSTQDLGFTPAWDSTWSEKWEGVLVCVDTVQVIQHREPAAYAEWVVKEFHNHPGYNPAQDSVIIDDKLFIPTLAPPPIGDTLAMIRGVFAEEYDNYKIWPRNIEDLEFMGSVPGPHLLQAYAMSDTSILAIFDRPLEESSAEDWTNYFLDSGTLIKQAVLALGDSMKVRLFTDSMPSGDQEILSACNIQAHGGNTMVGCEQYPFRAGITPIAQIQDPAHAGTDSSKMAGEQVTVAGIVTSRSGSFGGPFFMRDARGPWSGLYVYRPGANVQVGDSLIISGEVQEYYGWTELGDIDYMKQHTPVLPVLPDTVPPSVLRAGAPENESYEDCFVHMEMVEALTYPWPSTYGEWYAGDTLQVDSVRIGDLAIEEGDGYAYPGAGSIINISGCYRFFYDWLLEPRDTADIVVVIPCTSGITEGTALRASLDQNAPNPFVSGTTIKFAVPSKGRVRVAVYDVTGRLVRELADHVMTPGEYTVSWDGRDSRNEEVGPGIYFYTFKTPQVSMKKKMVVLK